MHEEARIEFDRESRARECVECHQPYGKWTCCEEARCNKCQMKHIGFLQPKSTETFAQHCVQDFLLGTCPHGDTVGLCCGIDVHAHPEWNNEDEY